MGSDTSSLDDDRKLRRLPTSQELFETAPSIRRSSVVVGATDDREEREADEVADRVVRHLSSSGAGDRARRSPGGPSADVEVGAAGGPISEELSRSIGSRPTSPLPEGVRRRMETGFGTDLSRVRMVADSPDAPRMQASAFTIGNDIHFAPGQFRPGSPDGDHTIAHEISHTLQSSGGVHRKMYTRDEFNTLTKQGRLTGKSTAQKDIGPILDQYHLTYPADDIANMDASKLEAARKEVTVMRAMAWRYLESKTDMYDAGDGPATAVVKKGREKRAGGMAMFLYRCDGELATLERLLEAAKSQQGGQQQPIPAVDLDQDERYTKLKAHYDADAQSSLRKLGTLIDMAVPNEGDSASLSVEVSIPVQPGIFVNLNFGVEAERDGNGVECGLTVSAGVAANVAEMAEIAGALGCYLKAKAKTGADVAELWSYALFRRCRESNLIPREVENFMWGGGDTGKFGWQKAENWSKNVEREILAKQEESYVESGGLASLSGKAGFGAPGAKVAEFEASAEGFTGTRIDKQSLQTRKGGAGADNKRSDSVFNLPGTSLADRGAQKRVGVERTGFALNVSAGNDFVGGGVGFSMAWRSNGVHGRKQYEEMEMELTGELGFTMPGGEIIAGGLVNMMPPLITTLNSAVARGKERATQETNSKRDLGALGGSMDSFATAIAGLNMADGNWTPPTTMDESVLQGFDTTTTFTLGVSLGYKKKKAEAKGETEFSITLNQDKTSEVGKAIEAFGEAAQVLKVSMSKTSRVLAIEWSDGKWKLNWAGGDVPLGGATP